MAKKPKSGWTGSNPTDPMPPQPGYDKGKRDSELKSQGYRRTYPGLERVYERDSLGQVYNIGGGRSAFQNDPDKGQNPKNIKALYGDSKELPGRLAQNTLARLTWNKTPKTKAELAAEAKSAKANALSRARAKVSSVSSKLKGMK